jgi:xanthine dehydrogenase YagS FAD-binding subunit
VIPSFSYIRVKSVKDAVTQLSDKRSRVMAGGTDLLSCLREGVFAAEKIVSITGVDDLHGIKGTSDGGLRIGALTTITEVSENPTIMKSYSGLAQAALNVASPQLRNQGTIGGNLCQKPRCWYYRGDFHCLRKGGAVCYAMSGENQYHAIFGYDKICAIVHPSDIAPALIACGAAVRVVGPSGSRLVPVEALHVLPKVDVKRETVLEPGEIISEIIIPKPAEGTKSSYRKVRARRSWDFALVGAAFAVEFKDGKVHKARAVFSGVAPVPWRSKELEDVITGKKLDAHTVSKAADMAVKNAEPLEGNEYKVAMLKGLVEEELLTLAHN